MICIIIWIMYNMKKIEMYIKLHYNYILFISYIKNFYHSYWLFYIKNFIFIVYIVFYIISLYLKYVKRM